MRRKLIVIIIAIMLGFPIIYFGDIRITKAEQHYLPEVNQDINVSFVHDIAQRLSNVTRIYSPGELMKGRAFGSNGERYAAKNILAYEMSHIGLYNLSSNPSYLELIKNYNYTDLFRKNHTINEELEVRSKSMKLINISTNPPNITAVDCYISPRWSLEGLFHGNIPDNKSDLTGNFNYTNLNIRHIPREMKKSLNSFINNSILDILIHIGNLSDYDALKNYTYTKFENYYNISFDNLTDHPESARNKSFYNATYFNQSLLDPYVFIEEDIWNNPDHIRNPRIHHLTPILNRFLRDHGLPGNLDDNRATISLILDDIFFAVDFARMRLFRCLPNCKGEIRFDYTNNSHDMVLNGGIGLPVLYINGTVGKTINSSVNNYRVDFNLSERWNASEISYNVIGQINGTDPSKIIMINSLYDCWWNQGAADSATACGMVLALARKYQDLNQSGIRPKQTLKFVLFGGEEFGMAGAHSYAYYHPQSSEHIETFIDLNQLGFTQPYPRLTMDIGTNKLSHKSLFKQMGEDTNYVERTKNAANFSVYWTPGGMISDDGAFIPRLTLTTITFLKDTAWFRHHRDGMNHTEGDSMKYYNSTDLTACASLIYNCTKYYCINPNCSFAGQITYTTKDSPDDPDNLVDTVEADMPLQSILSSDLVRVKAVLSKHVLFWYIPVATVEKDYIISTSVSHHTIDVTLPPYLDKGTYYLTLYLYNSTGRLDYIVRPIIRDHPNDTSSDYSVYLYPRGNEPPNTPTQPDGPSTLQVGERGTWTSVTSDPNHDLIGEQWYSKKSTKIIYVRFKDTGLYNPESTLPPVSHIFWSAEKYDIIVKAYDQYSGLLHPYESPFSTVKEVSVIPRSKIINPQQQLHQDQGNVLHLVQNDEPMLYGSQTGASSPQWQWTYGDGTSSGRYAAQNISHQYNNPGVYNLTLNVTDSQTQLTGSTTIRVRISALDSNFNMSYFHGTTPNTPISFRNVSKVISGKRIVNCTWNFGDGTISYQSNVNHTFTEEGDYNVSLTVKDNQSNIDTDYSIIDITSYPFPPEITEVQSPGIITNASDATILALVNPTDRNLSSVKVQITTPNNTTGNYTMTNLGGDIYLFTLNNSSLVGQYNFTVWATDTENNINSSSGSYYLMLPDLSYEPPTPENDAKVNHSWVKINVSVNDTYSTSAFIDWNHTLRGYWPMDVYNDTCIYDNSMHQNDGLFHNGMNASNITTGKYGKGLEFDGNDDYVDLGNDTSLNLGAGDFTFMVWEKSHASTYSNTTVILSNQPENANWAGYVCGVKNNAFFYTVQNGQTTLINGTHEVTDNTWHHLTYIRKGTNLSLYVDKAFDTGRTGTVRNVTNNKNTCFSYESRANWYHFDGVLDEGQLYSRALGRDEINASFNNGLYRLCHNFTGLADGTYEYYAHAIDVNGNQGAAEIRQVTVDTVAPTIINVSALPNTVGFGFNVTISTNVTDAGTGVKNVSAAIAYPLGGGNNPVTVPMSHISGTMYRYVFSDTWYKGRYNYTITACDNASNGVTSAVHSFNVSASATISISTLKDAYNANQYINITDPPNPPENLTVVGRGLTWNNYYNASSGCNILESYQGPVNYQDDNDSWMPINDSLGQLASNHPAYNYGYRAGNNHGLFGAYFKPNVQSDWPVAFSYNRSDNPTAYVVRSKLVGVGYVDPLSDWAYQYLQSVQSSQGQFTGNTATYQNVFTGTDVTWGYGNTGLKEAITMSNVTKTVLQNHPPSSYGLHDASSYLVFITKLDHQNLNMYNASGMLNGNVTISDRGVDFRDALGQFKCALPLGDAYELNNESMREKLTYRIVHLNGNTYLLSGLKVSDLNAMAFPVVIDPTLTVYSTSSDGYIYNSGTNYNTVRTASSGTINSSGTFITIGQKMGPGQPATYYVYRGFVFFNTSALPSNAYLDNATLSLFKKDDYSTTDFSITVQNGQPAFPHNPMQSGDYNKNYYSGNGGTYNTSGFHNGLNNMSLTNLNWVTKGGTTKLCLRSSRDINGNTPTGNEYVNVYSHEYLGGNFYQPKLVVVYRNQSKIKNTGSTAIKAYLLIQIQYYNAGQGKWLVEKDTINETSPRTINGGNQLALDTIFNSHVKTNDLTHNNSNYRVYAAFRDPDQNILKTNDGKELVAWWQFTVYVGT